MCILQVLTSSGRDTVLSNMSKQIRVLLNHDGSVIRTQLSIPPPSLAIVNGITVTSSSQSSTIITNQIQMKQGIEDFLNDVWSIFGTVTNVIYHKYYTYATITYQHHITAVYAYAAINDPIQLAVAMQSVIGSNVQRAQYAKLLFQPEPSESNGINNRGPVRTCTPTWVD